MAQRKSALPIGALPIPPEQALPIAPLSQQDEALRDANNAVLAVLQHYGAEHVERTARARRAGSTPKQKIASKHDEMVEVWAAEREYRIQHGGRVEKGRIDQIVADRFKVAPETVKRARLKSGV